MAIKTKLRGRVTEDAPYKAATLSVSFTLHRGDVVQIMGRDIILEVDPDLDEEGGLDWATERVASNWSNKAVVEKSVRAALLSGGVSHRSDEDSLSEAEIREHRPACAQMIDDCINRFLPQLNVSDEDIIAFLQWKENELKKGIEH